MENTEYQNDLEFIRKRLKEIQKPEPSPDFFEKTRSLCYSKLDPNKSSQVPKSIWIAFVLNIVLIGLLMLPFSKALKSGQPLSMQMVGVLVIMIQNAVMLLFAPVIIKKFKEKQENGNRALIT